MAQKNRAQMLIDITSNIFNNVINYITGQNAQDRFVNLLDSSPNIISDKDQANGYVGLDGNGAMFSSYYNENISRADLQTLLTNNLAVTYKFYQINDAVGASKIILVCADSNITLYQFGIDANTGEIGTYDIVTDSFNPIVSTGNANIVYITNAALITLGSTSGISTTTFYVVTNAAAGQLLTKGKTSTTIDDGVLNLDTGESGTYVLATDTFTSAGGGVASVNSGININVDNTDPANPIINSLSDRYKTTSLTSNTIGNGSKTFTVDANLSYIPLQEVLVVYDVSNHMHGTVTSYSGTTLIVDIKHNTGSGTYTLWSINLDGTPVDAITGSGTANRLAYFTAAQVIDDAAAITASRALISDINGIPTHSATTSTELGYVSGVTSAIQTQLNTASTLSIECISGTITTPVDATTYFWCIGGTFLTASTASTGQGSKFAYNFELIGITIRMTTTTAGSNEDSTLYLRNITAGTSTLMGTFKTNGNLAYTSITGLTISCNTTDEYCLEARTPTWATNPANLRLTASLFLRRT
jgi:hypothetical protein